MKKEQWIISAEQLMEWKELLSECEEKEAETVIEQIDDILRQMGYEIKNREVAYYIVSNKNCSQAEYGWILCFDPDKCQRTKDYIELVDELGDTGIYKLEHADVTEISYEQYSSLAPVARELALDDKVLDEVLQLSEIPKTEYYIVHQPESEYFGWIFTHIPTVHENDGEYLELLSSSTPVEVVRLPLADITAITKEEFEVIDEENKEAGDPNSVIERVLRKYRNYLELEFVFQQCTYNLFESLEEVANCIAKIMEIEGYTLAKLKKQIVFKNATYHDLECIFEKVEALPFTSIE